MFLFGKQITTTETKNITIQKEVNKKSRILLKFKNINAQSRFTTPICKAVAGLALLGKSTYKEYNFGWQETNDCTSWGTCEGFDQTQVAQAHRGIETFPLTHL